MRKLLRSKVLLAATVFGSFAFAFAAVQTVGAQTMLEDCSSNSIISCGATSPANLINKIKANKTGDLKTVFDDFNLSTDEYSKFAEEAKVGTAYKDGRIVVDGQVVARNAWSIGREAKSYSEKLKIGDETYHKSDATEVFNRDSMPVFVWFNDKGVVETAVLQPCGNPMGGETVVPTYKCQDLKREAVSGKENTYRFSTTAPVTNGASISKVVYDFGDGSSKVTKTKPGDVVTHTYTKAGTFTAKVTVYAELPGGNEVVVNGNGCAQQVTVKEEEKPPVTPPPVVETAAWECSKLTATPQTQSDNSYSYTLRANASMSNARLVKADFDFGDGSATSGVTPVSTDSNTVSTTHTYIQAKAYTAKATLHFEATDDADAEGKSTSVSCEVSFTITKPVVLSAVTTTPSAPPTLPAAGAASMAGLFGGASILGTLGYRWRVSRKINRVDELIDRLTYHG